MAEPKSTEAQEETKTRKKRAHGPNWERARHLYIKYPLLPTADLADILGVSRQAVYKYVEGEELMEEREKRRKEALVKLKRKEGL